MHDGAAENEPTMEEILASIRRIISEDEEEDQTSAQADASVAADPDPMPDPMPEPPPAVEEPADDVLDLTDMVAQTEPEPAPQAPPAPPIIDTDALLSEETVKKAAGAFASLSSRTMVQTGASAMTLEALVQEMLRPMLKDWLDAELPSIVERVVEREVQRLTAPK